MVGRAQSIQFSHSVVSDSLWPHESQHARPPCPTPTPRVHSNSCPSSQWCHPAICRPLLLLPPIPPSIRVFANESTLRIRWPKYWSFSFSIIPSKEIPGLIPQLTLIPGYWDFQVYELEVSRIVFCCFGKIRVQLLSAFSTGSLLPQLIYLCITD